MKLLILPIIAACLTVFTGAAVVYGQDQTGNAAIAFPKDYAKGVHYNTMHRGNVREEMFTTPAAVEAAKAGKPLPDGTVIVNEWYEGDTLTHYFVMEKQQGWGDAYPESVRDDDWRFRDFGPDKNPNLADDGSGCMSCHHSQAAHDFVWTYSQMAGSH
jgi:hypothetical protein